MREWITVPNPAVRVADEELHLPVEAISCQPGSYLVRIIATRRIVNKCFRVAACTGGSRQDHSECPSVEANIVNTTSDAFYAVITLVSL